MTYSKIYYFFMAIKESSSRGAEYNIREKAPKLGFKEQLIGVFQKKYPELVTASIEEQEELKKQLEERENTVDDQEVADLLKEYGLKNVEIKERDGLFYLPVKDHFSKERLPVGYGYKGGAARELLTRSLGLPPLSQPRDIDPIRLIKDEPFPGSDKDVLLRFSPDDMLQNTWMDVELDHKEYFATRDLSINEILATDDQIIVTRQCLLDTVRHIIRPTGYERELFEGNLGPKMTAKIIKFYCEMIERYGGATTKDVDDWELERSFIPPFYIASQLDKMSSHGKEKADSFVRDLVRRTQLPSFIKNTEEAVAYLNELIGDDRRFYFRYAPVDQFKFEESLVEERMLNLPSFVGTRKGARKGKGKRKM